jgi:hypothetical protein
MVNIISFGMVNDSQSIVIGMVKILLIWRGFFKIKGFMKFYYLF